MPIIVGAPRSGTTLLRFMIDAHPAIAIPPETGFLTALSGLAAIGAVQPDSVFKTITGAPTWPDFQIAREAFRTRLNKNAAPAEAARCFYQMYAEKHGKSRWGDKTPLYGLHMLKIQSLLPEAHFIHLIRDGRDVALSLRGVWFSPSDDIETLAAYWRDTVVATREQSRGCAHYLEVHYEELVRDPPGVLEQVANFITLDFDPCMLRYFENAPRRLEEHGERWDADGKLVVGRGERHRQQSMTTAPPDQSRIFGWRRDLSRHEGEVFKKIAGGLLRQLGYDNT
ncbi:MAG TPA: sulfotransferase [Xanthobacteraceae bacterium]|nr:sulfotransferase [Xanthobacteraceae bacterium]